MLVIKKFKTKKRAKLTDGIKRNFFSLNKLRKNHKDKKLKTGAPTMGARPI